MSWLLFDSNYLAHKKQLWKLRNFVGLTRFFRSEKHVIKKNFRARKNIEKMTVERKKPALANWIHKSFGFALCLLVISALLRTSFAKKSEQDKPKGKTGSSHSCQAQTQAKMQVN